MAEHSVDELLGIAKETDDVWELFHENSKNVRALLENNLRSAADIQREMQKLHEELPYSTYTATPLPASGPLHTSLGNAINERETTRNLSPRAIQLAELSALLHHAYGMLRDSSSLSYPPRARAVASAGALYPLELYLHAADVVSLNEGLYHYSPKGNCLQYLKPLRQGHVCDATLYPDLVSRASLTVFVTALFERSTWKYGARGYRYALLEAGAVAHAMSLAATALGLGSLNVGGFVDSEVDDLLELDGVSHSTLHLLCFGGPPERDT